MKLAQILAENIIDFAERKKQREKEEAKKTFNRKMENLPQQVSSALVLQSEVEREVSEKLSQIEKESKTNQGKFKSPTLQSEYPRRANPVFIMYIEASLMPDEPYKRDVKQKLAVQLAKQYREEILGYLKQDLEKMERVYEVAEKAPAPQYPEAQISRKTLELKRMIQFFEKELPKIVTGDDETLGEGDVVSNKFEQRLRSKKGMIHNPDVEPPISLKDKKPFDYFETENVGDHSASIWGVRKDGYRENIGTTERNVAKAIAGAYNAGGYSKHRIQKLSFADYFKEQWNK